MSLFTVKWTNHLYCAAPLLEAIIIILQSALFARVTGQ